MGKIQLASVRLRQGSHAAALAGYEAARAIFATQNEPATIATIWHQIGMVQQDAGAYDAAETAYLRSLKIETQLNNRTGQASSLNMLGILYVAHLNRPEEAVTFYRQAAAIFVALSDLRSEGVTRNNIANTLYKLGRYAEARPEILRAIECARQFGHAAEPWKTFAVLQQIESTTGNPAAARAAWEQARATYLAYQRQGGYAQQGNENLVEHVLGLMAQQKVDAIAPLFEQLLNDPASSDSRKQTVRAMAAIFSDSRDPALRQSSGQALADDPSLNYADAAEILFLIERLG